ncbi:MAG: class I SAM-dependent methyltransferase [Candidatus Dormibacteraceae bacterium]
MEKEKLYGELADWWPTFSVPEEYRKEAAYFARALIRSVEPAPRTVLELGAGGGNNAFHLKKKFAMTLVDLSPQMLALSRALNPDCEHHQGDIRTIRLGRTFDAVFVYDAICHMTAEADLRAVMHTAFEHLRPGGVAMFVPDFVRETFVEYTDHGGNDTPRGSVRYVQWVSDPDPRDTTYLVDFGILVRDGKGQTRLVHDRHTYGLFPRPTWRRLVREVGFDLRAVRLPEGFGRDLFAGRRKR